MKLNGKVAVITGAASGIGRATAELFVAEGASVSLWDINFAALEELADHLNAKGGSVQALDVDVTNAQRVKQAAEETMQKFGRIDVLFNNAGWIARGSVLETSEEDFDRVMNINVKGVFLGSKYVIPYIRQSGGGAIVNTGSGSSVIATKNTAGYCASKGAVLQLTKQMALDYAEDGIRVNAVAPGVVDTPQMRAVWSREPDPDGIRKAVAARHPMQRLAVPEEVAKAVLFLASDDASFTTGTALMVDGGYTAQ